MNKEFTIREYQPGDEEEIVEVLKASFPGWNKMENALAELSNGLLICDTNAFATGLWHEHYMGKRSSSVDELASYSPIDLYILTGDEIPFVQDGLRDGQAIRHHMHQRFIERLEEEHKPYIIVTGNHETRLQEAVKTIDQL